MSSGSAGVQTVQRALHLLETIADNGAALNVTMLAESADLPLPTAHRLLKTMVSLGYVRQLSSRKYGLGTKLIQLGNVARESFGVVAEPFLAKLVESTGETANLAVLENDMAVYVAQMPSRHSMRMFTEIGRRVLPHCTGVGKAILSQLPENTVASIVGRTGMPAQTDRTLTNINQLLGDLQVIRTRGWAEDNGEKEVGVRCIAVPIQATGISAAVSVSGPEARMTAEAVARIVPELKDAARQLAEAFRSESE